MPLLDFFQNNQPIPNFNPGMAMVGMSLLNNEEINPMQIAALMSMAREKQNTASGTTPASDNYSPMPNFPTQQTETYDPTFQNMPYYPLPNDKQQMLMLLKNEAAKAYPDNPLMQQVAITQAIHESGLMGKPSQLASRNNNLFGIKGQGTAGAVNMPTQEFMGGRMQSVNDSFARNQSVADSFMQHRNLLNKQRYAPVLMAQNPSAAFNALQKSGYATDPRYANKLNNVYTRYVAPLY